MPNGHTQDTPPVPITPKQPPPSIHVGMRSPISDSTALFHYTLENGIISARSLTPENPRKMVSGDLVYDANAIVPHAFDGVGIPYGEDGKSLLSEGEIITQIGAAGGMLIAISSLGPHHNQEHYVYLYHTYVLERPVVWRKLLGQPSFMANNLILPANNRGFTVSSSIGYPFKPNGAVKRTLQTIARSEQVDYYTDLNGVNHNFGHTTTIYILLNDGRKIVYWDTGLPPSFSRGLLTPERGSTQGQSLSAAVSTLFISVLDEQGRLRFFTRMIDYEINGSCLGLKHTYTNTNPIRPPAGASMYIGCSERKLPLKDWREHSLHGIDPNNISCEVSIYLTGQGNSARELRIAGRDQRGNYGFYYKNIDSKSWLFLPSGILPRIPLLPFIPYPFSYETPPLLKEYSGIIKKNQCPEVTITLVGFHHFLTAETPCYIALTHADKTIYLKLHVVDGWGLINHLKFHEELIGTDDEPKLLRATLLLTTKQKKIDRSTPLGRCIATYFLSLHDQVNKLYLRASDSSVSIDSEVSNFKITFNRKLSQQEITNSFYVKLAMSPYLSFRPANFDQLKMVIMLNQRMLDYIKKIHSKYSREILKFSLIIPTGALAIKHVIHMILRLGFKKDDHRIKTALDEAIPLFRRQQKIARWCHKNPESFSYTAAVQELENRLWRLNHTPVLRPMPVLSMVDTCRYDRPKQLLDNN